MTQKKKIGEDLGIAEENFNLESLKSQTLASIQNVLSHIKPFNQTALALIRTIDEEQTTNVEVLTEKICMDQAMVTRILRITNSPFYGMSGHITSIPEAIAVLGYRSLRSLAIAMTLDDQFGHDERFKMVQLWPERLFIAHFAHHMAPFMQLNRDSAYCMGLLHDIGKLVLYKIYPDYFSLVQKSAKRENIPFYWAERNHFGIDYAEVGKIVCEAWKIPSLITTAIGHHLEPKRKKMSYSLLLHAGLSLYAMTTELGFQTAVWKKTETDPLFRELGFTQSICEKYMGNLMEEVHQTMMMLSDGISE